MQRAHTYRGRRGSPRHRPRQLRLARHLVRAVRALQPSSGCRESSALLEAIRVKGSGRGHGRPRPEVSEQPDRLSGCSYTIGGSQGPPQPEPFTRMRGGKSANVFHRFSRRRGSTVLMGNSLAEMLSTFSWLAHYGFWVNRHTLRVEFTYESRMRSLGIQALEGARMKSFLRTG